MPNAFAHLELNTDDLAVAKAFYQAVFAWKMKDIPEGNYTMIDVGKGTGGGMQKKPMPEMPSAWLPYVEVADVKQTVAKAAAAGAHVAVEHMDIGEFGAIGIFIDPTGASLGVWQPKKAAAAPAKRAAKKKPAAKKPAAKKPAKAKAKKGARKR
jgi:predicted enzyme related to lactoylglutathione lyase